MIQKDYILENPMSAGRALGDLVKTLKTCPHKDALLTVYETGFPESQIRGLIDSIKKCGENGLKVAGISTYAIADIPVMAKGVRLNLVMTETSDIEVLTLPCGPGEEDGAILRMRERLDAHPDAKAIQLFVCNNGLNVTRFMEKSVKGREDIGIFGTMSSRKLSDTLVSKGFTIDLFDVFRGDGRNYDRNQFVIGDSIIENGFVAVIFSGKELNVKLDYALGWHPIGKEMPVVKGEKGLLGETCLTEIDGMSPVELYHEYLGVRPDDYFIRNICEFPLMVRRNGIDICLIPFDYGKDGEVYFTMSVEDDEKLYFSYGTHDEVLGAAKASCEDMADFAPQALFLVLCGNRVNFLQEDARFEWEGFRTIAPDCAVIHGASELYYQHGRGGVLNSAHVSVGMREGDKPADKKEHEPIEINCLHHHKVVPLAERMSVFMDKMTKQLESMAEEAEAANQAKSAFLSSMSHEIRTPINAILGMDEMILRESNEAESIEYAENIRSAGNSLLGIVNDILDFSKIEAGKLDIIPVEYEFASVINDLVNVIRKRAEDKGLELKLDIDPSVPAILYGDEIRIRQVITNILTNAVKYTEKGSVTLRIRRCLCDGQKKHSDGHEECHGMACFRNPVKLEVSVTDTGIGIKESDRERLFNAFERVDEKRNRTIEGTGLGLSITTSLLSLMGSSLKLDSEYGKGSTFSFVIVQGISRDEPVGDLSHRWSRSASVHRRYQGKFTAPGARILVVDDTTMNLDVVKNLLKKTGIGIDTAESGQEALELVAEKPYDLIFLDHRMPGMDGIECFKLMKELPQNKCKDAPVISLTANAVSGAREEYLTLGFSDYLTKPIDSEKLEDMLIRYLPQDKVQMLPQRNAGEKAVSAGSSSEPGRKPLIIMIDDEALIHDVAKNILGDSYELKAYASGDDYFSSDRTEAADLILLDVNMPDKDGLTVMKELRSDSVSSDIPVIFLTGDESRDTEIEGFKAGAWDFVRKPFAAEVLRQRVRHTIELSRLQKDLSREVVAQTMKVEHLSEEIMLALSKAVDAKDHYTNGHSERVAGYAALLAMKLGMDEREQYVIHSLGLLHDVGKIGVPGEIINKPSRLSDDEFAQIKKHAGMGYDILKTITELPELATGARWHHERYDGSGYPDGRAGEDIPLAARIICVADCYDAMTSNRSYSKIREQSEVREEFVRCSGTQFDPEIAEQMIVLIDEDRDYLMNEKGYDRSEAARHAKELLKSHKKPDIMREAVPEFKPEDEPEEEEAGLPGWLIESGVLDIEKGVKHCGSVEGFLSMLKTFHATVEERAGEIEEYYRAQNWKDYTTKVHALKSSARIIGASELSKAAELLEKAGDENDIDTIKKDTERLLSMYREYRGKLDQIEEKDQTELPDAPESEIRDAYQALSEFSELQDYELARMVLDSMKEYRLPEGDRECFERLQDMLLKLDWDGMKKMLEDRG